MMGTMDTWDKLKAVPVSATKKIGGGRLKGFTDIKPQWRYQRLTEAFGPCGIGWKFEITRQWEVPGSADQLMCFCNVNLFFKHEGGWSDPIPGTGGSLLVEQESKGPHTSDEGHKMALTDAIGTAAKMIGLASDIYMGLPPETKHTRQEEPAQAGNPALLTMILDHVAVAESLPELNAVCADGVKCSRDEQAQIKAAHFEKKKLFKKQDDFQDENPHNPND